MQGERDANAINAKQMTATEFESALKNVIARFRAELGNNLPVYIVLTGYYANHPKEGYDVVRKIQRKVVREVPGVILASIDPGRFPKKKLMTDDIHYSQVGYNRIGTILAKQIATKRNK